MRELEKFKDDDLLKDILRKNSKKLTNVDFEHQMMLEIHAEVRRKKEVHAKLVRSLRYCIWALILSIGLAVSLLFGEALIPYGKTFVVMSLFILSVVAILNSGNYRRLIRMYQV